MIDDVSDQDWLLCWVYVQQSTNPNAVLVLLQPTTALSKICRDCKLNPTRAACMRRRRVRRARRAPRRQRGCSRAAGSRDDGGGDSGDGDGPPAHLTHTDKRGSAPLPQRSVR